MGWRRVACAVFVHLQSERDRRTRPMGRAAMRFRSDDLDPRGHCLI